MKKKLLITGASGFLGYHLMRLAADWEVYGIYYSKIFNYNKAVAVKCDITDYIELGNFFDDIEPNAVIHSAAVADPNVCQENKELSHLVNVEATRNIAGICCDYNIPLAFTSTDLVFDGTKGMYKENDSKNPLSLYGEQKSIAEEEVLKIYPGASVFRLPMMFGFAEASADNYTRKFIAQMRKGETATLFTDEFRSVCGAKSIAEGILHLFEKVSGVVHLGGRERISRYEYGQMVVRAFGISTGTIVARTQKEVKLTVPRPADVSLDISKTLSLGFNPMRAEEELGLVSSKIALTAE